MEIIRNWDITDISERRLVKIGESYIQEIWAMPTNPTVRLPESHRYAKSYKDSLLQLYEESFKELKDFCAEEMASE